MIKQRLPYRFLFFILLCNISLMCGQGFIDPGSSTPYLRVFVETDDFDASYLDQLEEGYPLIKVDSLKFSALNDLAYYTHTRDLKKSLDLARTGLEMAKESNNSLWEGRFQITEGAILLRMEHLDAALIVLKDAEQKVQKQDLPLLYTQVGYVYEKKGDIMKAADFAIKCKVIGEELNDTWAIAQAYSDLSNLYWKYSDYDKALEFGLYAVELFEELRMNSMDYDFVLYVVGNNLLKLNKYQDALRYFRHAISIGEKYGFYNNLSDINISLIDLYTEMNQYEAAEIAGQEAIKYATLVDNDFLLMRCWLSLGRLKLFQGKYKDAIDLLNRSLEVAGPEFGDKFYLSRVFEHLGRAYAKSHNYKDAIDAFTVYDSLEKEVFIEVSNQRMALLQSEFDLDAKNSTIEGMEARIKKQSSTQTLITIITGLLMVLLLVLYVTYQNNRKKNILLENQNEEKEFLLKEIHHRVKNNLGIVSSLLDLQAEKIRDPKIVEAIKESRNRVYSMSMIHQKLYQGTNLSSIGMKEYLIELSQHILDSFGAKNRISFQYKLEDMQLDVDSAIPMGLIVNELLTNSFKHAFPKNKMGVIKITCQQLSTDRVLLEVADNGIGIIEVDNNHGDGFGTQLIDLLIVQLDGSIMNCNGAGTKVRMEFMLN